MSSESVQSRANVLTHPVAVFLCSAVRNFHDVLIVRDKSASIKPIDKWRAAVRALDREKGEQHLRAAGKLSCCLRTCAGEKCFCNEPAPRLA